MVLLPLRTDQLARAVGKDVDMNLDEYFAEVLRNLNMAPTAKRLAMLRAWAVKEGMVNGSNPYRRLDFHWNPLATTRMTPTLQLTAVDPFGHGTGNWNSVPVRIYADAANGIAATYQTLLLTYYPNIRASLAQETGLDAAVPDFKTWVGSEAYGRDLVSQWKAIGASGEQEPTPEPEKPITIDALNAALVKREQIRGVASIIDLPTVERAHAALVREGIIT